LEDFISVFTNMWAHIETNKKVGGLFPNDGDVNAWGDKVVVFPPVLEKMGYCLIDPGVHQTSDERLCPALPSAYTVCGKSSA
ncbi:hypothetical protein ACC754_42665, partial [Rhizobium johnstonii]